ncbi:MAG: hypothetical protein JNK67_06995 [Alphaproteobacteria bacterium]|nr:hypothetical protein [Alphaproteobacteria bacterium]
MKSGPVVLSCLALALLACAERQARTIAAEQPHDAQLTCFQIASERASIRRTVASYEADRRQQDERNAMSIAAAPFNPMNLMLMDVGDAATRETAAYERRLVRLGELARSKGCPDD